MGLLVSSSYPEFWLVLTKTNAIYSAPSLRPERFFVYQVSSLNSCSPAKELNFKGGSILATFFVFIYVEKRRAYLYFFFVLASAETFGRFTLFDTFQLRGVEFSLENSGCDILSIQLQQ
jgi:hypothetical protein